MKRGLKRLLALIALLGCATPAFAQTAPTSGPKYCAALNQVVTDLIGLPAEVAASAPGVYQSELFLASVAVQNNMDPTVKPTHAVIAKAAQDSEDCFPVNQHPA